MEPDFSKAPPPNAAAFFTSSTVDLARVQNLLAEAVARHEAGDLTRARDTYMQVLALDPGQFDALHFLGVLAAQSGDAAQAVARIGQALAINPYHAAAHVNLGLAYAALDRPQAAVDSYDAAIALDPLQADTFVNRGIAYRQLKQHAAALASYDAAIALKPDHAAAHSNRGVTLGELEQYDAALAAYDRAIALKPDLAEAHNNRGLALYSLGRAPEALAAHDEAIRIDPDCGAAHAHRGHILMQFGRRTEALAAYDRALRQKPEPDYLYGTRLHLKMLLCDWSDFYAGLAELCARIARGGRASPSFPLLALIDSPALHRQAAATWASDKHPPNAMLGAAPKSAPHAKIRVGYFSMDFRDHPVSSLTVGLFEAHDRDTFETYGVSYGVDTKDAMRKRLEGAFDHFFDVRDKTDIEVAMLARELQLDIAVDLAGYTDNARTGIFALRAAPVQVSYLGYLGTMAADYIDYVIADATVIPEGSRKDYSEKIAQLPTYQVNDTSRKIAEPAYTRAALGLPATGFVFCCFNNTYKITPAIFGGWMRILSAVPGSVLFLYADDALAMDNLRREAKARGVDAERLVFGKRLAVPEYLARLQAADLFLDTLPYNAGTTASDALWVGLPVLTLIGKALAGRVAASLLHAVGLSELITSTQAEYEALAIALAHDPARCAGLKAKLARNRLIMPLFDAKVFARRIEEAYRLMHACHHAGLPPDHVIIDPSIEEQRI